MLQTGLFGDVVESFAQQFSAAQKQTEAIKHILRQRKSAASTPAAAVTHSILYIQVVNVGSEDVVLYPCTVIGTLSTISVVSLPAEVKEVKVFPWLHKLLSTICGGFRSTGNSAALSGGRIGEIKKRKGSGKSLPAEWT